MKPDTLSLPHGRELNTALAAARAAGALIASRWDREFEIRHKGTIDLVTEVDLAAESIVTQAISAAFPKDGIVAEEGSSVASQSGRSWVVDPLDGTTNFSNGLPHFAVSIALWDQTGAVVGVVHDPIRDWTFWSARGAGAWRNDRRLSVSQALTLPNALLATGFPYDRHTSTDNNTHRFSRLIRQCRGVRRAGAAALDLAYVAAGWLDGYWETKLSPWDIAAGALLVAEAGGCVTGLDGGPMDLQEGRLVATNGAIHESLVASLATADAQFETSQ